MILVAVVALAGLAAIHSASSNIRDAASQASGTPSLFLYLFTVSPDRVPAFYEFIGFLGPLLGIALGFDAISSERSQRTLPRLVSQPIHRDEDHEADRGDVVGQLLGGDDAPAGDVALRLCRRARLRLGDGVAGGLKRCHRRPR